MIDILKKNSTPILGGDVYLLKGNAIEAQGANWYYERKDHENFRDYTNHSCEEAERYIRNYLENQPDSHQVSSGKLLFDLVIFEFVT